MQKSGPALIWGTSSSVRIAGPQTKIWTQELLDVNQMCKTLYRNVRSLQFRDAMQWDFWRDRSLRRDISVHKITRS
jgi:hypothetical protein